MFYVVGDIENSSTAYRDAIELIDKVKCKNTIVFLGDIYTPMDPNGSVTRIRTILNKFGIRTHEFIHYKTSASPIEMCKKIHRKLELLAKDISLDIYSDTNKIKTSTKTDLIKSVLADDMARANDCFDKKQPIFMFGNKELDILRDLLNLQGVNVSKGMFTGNFKYVSKQQQKLATISFTIDELNVLMTYLSLCMHCVYRNGIMLAHIYINIRSIIRFINSDKYKGDKLVVHSIIAGHNRSYGKFFDTSLRLIEPRITIYLLDISHHTKRHPRNFIEVNDKKISFITDDDELKFMFDCIMDASTTFLKTGWSDKDDMRADDVFHRFLGVI